MSTDAELAGAIEIDERPFINSLHNAEAAWGRFNGGLAVSSGFESVSRSAVAMGTVVGNVATSIIRSMTSVASSALETGVSFLKMKEQATTAFTNLLGSADKAKGFIKELADFANKTPFEFGELTKAAQKFTAMGFSAKEVIPILSSVGNAVAAMGGSSEQIDRVSTALVQMKAKGKVSAQEMMQLAEAGIPAWQILAEKIGISIPEAMKRGEKGAISASFAIAALTEGMDKRFGGMMEKQSHTFAGLMSTIKDTSQQVLGSILEPLFKSATASMQGFVNLLPDVQSGISTITDQTKLAAVAFTGLALAAGAAATAIALTLGGPAALAVAGLGIEVAALAAIFITNFGEIQSAVTAWTGSTKISFSDVARYIGMGADAFSIFVRSILMGVDMVGTGITIMVQTFKGIAGIMSGFATSVKGVLTFDPTAVVAGVAQMEGAFTRFDSGVSTQLHAFNQRMKTNIAANAENFNGKYAGAFESGASKIVKAFSDTGKAIENQGKSLAGLPPIAEKFRNKVVKPYVDGSVEISGAFTSNIKAANVHVKTLGGLAGAADANMQGVMGGGGAKKGKAEAAKILKENIDLVNEMLDTLKAGVKISKDYWDRIPIDTKAALTAQSIVIKQFNEARKNLAIKDALSNPREIELTVGQYGRLINEVQNLTAAGIKVKIALVDVSDAMDKSAKSAHEFLTQANPLDTWAADFKKELDALSDALIAQTKASGEALKEGWLKWAKGGEAAKEWGKVMTEAVNKAKDDIRDALGDGIGGALIALAAKFGWHLDKVRGWAGDIVGIVDTLPGKFGDMARDIFSTIQQWAAFADRVLSILHRLDSDIPGSIGGIISKIGGIFKKTQTTTQTGFEGISGVIKNASEDWSATLEDMSNGVGDSVSKAMGKAQGAAKTGMAGFIDTIKGGLGFAAGLFGSFMVGNQVAGATGSKAKGAIMGGISGALSGAATGAAWGAAGGPIGAGVGALIGAGAGIIGGLLGGGKSAAQKAAEEQAKQKAGLDMQKLAADIMSSQMDGLKKGYELLEGLRTFSEVPRKAILRFFNSIEQIITLFAEMAKKFKADSIEASKTVAEVMTGAFESLLSGANLIRAIKEVGVVTDQNISDFIDTTFKIFQKWSDAADKIEVSTAKFTGKIADKLRTSFEFLNIVPDLLKGITENKGFDASLIDPLFDSVQKIVDKMKALSESERGLELNRTGATASILAVIFDTTKSIVEALSLFANYKPLGEGAFSPINGDIVRVTDWMNGLVTTTASWGSLADAALANVNRWADGLGKTAAAIKAAIGGAGSGSGSGITANLQYQGSGLSSLRSGGGSSSSTSSIVTQHNTFQITLSLKDLEELAEVPDKVRWLERKLNDSGSRTGQKAQGYASY